MCNSHNIHFLDQNNGIVSEEVDETRVVDDNHSSNSIILLGKDRKRKEKAWR